MTLELGGNWGIADTWIAVDIGYTLYRWGCAHHIYLKTQFARSGVNKGKRVDERKCKGYRHRVS